MACLALQYSVVYVALIWILFSDYVLAADAEPPLKRIRSLTEQLREVVLLASADVHADQPGAAELASALKLLEKFNAQGAPSSEYEPEATGTLACRFHKVSFKMVSYWVGFSYM